MNTEHSVFLLVEDNEDDAFFMTRAFKAAGFTNPLHIVTNGEPVPIPVPDASSIIATRKTSGGAS